MFRKLTLTILEVFPWLLRSVSEILPGTGDGDNRGSLDPNG